MSSLRNTLRHIFTLHTIGYLDAILILVFGLWLLMFVNGTYGKFSCNEFIYSKDKRIQFIAETLNEKITEQSSVGHWVEILEDSIVWEPSIERVSLKNLSDERILAEAKREGFEESQQDRYRIIVRVKHGTRWVLIFEVSKSECLVGHSFRTSTLFWIPLAAVIVIALFSLLLKFFIYGFIETKIETKIETQSKRNRK